MLDEYIFCELSWEETFNAQEWGRYPPEDLIRFIAKRFYTVPVRRGIKILEIGCGPGANLCYLAKEGFSVYGIDISKTAISKAKQRLNQDSSDWNGKVIVGDMLTLPFNDGFFDAILDVEAVYCNSYAKSKKIYEEAARVCKNKGYLYSRTFATGSWGDKTGEKIENNTWLPSEGPFVGKGVSRFTEKDELIDLLARFNIIEMELLSRTVNQLKHEIKEWSVVAQKI